MTTTGPDPAADYLARLDVALRDVPFGTASEIRAGIEEELASLPLAARRQRIVELGDPVRIASEAAEGSSDAAVHAAASTEQASRFGRGPWHVVSTAIAIGIGGLVVPVLGWVVGLVLLWTGRIWSRPERWFATLAPLVATLIAVGIWWLAQGGPVAGSMSAPEPGFRGRWLLLLGWVVGNVAIGAWLLVTGLRRTRG